MDLGKLLFVIGVVAFALVLFYRPNVFTFKSQDFSVWEEYENTCCEIFVIHCSSAQEGLALFESKHPEWLVIEYLFKDDVLWIKAVRK